MATTEKKAQERHVRLKASIWLDEMFLSLPVIAQWLYLAIISQPGVSLCGVIQPSYKRWATFAPEITAEDTEKGVLILQEHSFVAIDDDTDELLIRSFVRHGVALDSPNAIVGMSKSFETIHSKDLRKVVIEELRKVQHEDLLKGLSRKAPEVPVDGGKPKPPLRDRVSSTFLAAWEGAS
jgi:hypothetical protein